MFALRLCASILIPALVTAALAASPLGPEFTYQGQLKDALGAANGLYDFEFQLFDAGIGGAQLGSAQCVNDVEVADGLFEASLNFGDAFNGDARYLEVRVRTDTGLNCGEPEEFVVLTPRQRLTAAPYALQTRGMRVDAAGNVGIGTAAPLVKLHVAGGRGYFPEGLDVGGDDTTSLIKLRAFNETETAIYGKVTALSGSFAHAIYGQSDSHSGGSGVFGLGHIHGVQGLATGKAGTAMGGVFTSDSTEGVGVFGIASANTGINYGVRGNADSTAGYAGYFEGRGYFSHHTGIGTANPATRLHVEGGSDAALSGGGFITAGAITATNIAIDNNEILARNGGSASTLFINTEGGNVNILQGGTGNVGIGVSNPTFAKVHMSTTNQRCIYGVNNSSLNATAYFENTGVGPAGIFEGDLSVIGTLSKSSGSFRIDHPLDPANKYLSHSFVESPDMMNIYNGNVVTDERGYATIVMPEWFNALNREFRYQLTVIDESDSPAFAQAKVVGTMSDNQFTIRTSVPQVHVSWQVTGVRQDAWAEAHRIPIEHNKPPHERGRYLHPELFNQPPELGLDYASAQMDPSGAPEEPK